MNVSPTITLITVGMMKATVAPLPSVGVAVAGPSVGVGVSVGQTPPHDATDTVPPVVPPTGSETALIDTRTTPLRVSGDVPGISACSVRRASVPAPLGGATDAPVVKQPYVTLLAVTIAELH